jgi:hypothetical protein
MILFVAGGARSGVLLAYIGVTIISPSSLQTAALDLGT